MCKAGGPRCTGHARATMEAKFAAAHQAGEEFENATPEQREKALAKLNKAAKAATQAREQYDTTTGGLADLTETLRADPDDPVALRRFQAGYTTRLAQLQAHDLSDGRPVRRDLGLLIDGQPWTRDGAPYGHTEQALADDAPLSNAEAWAKGTLTEYAYDWRGGPGTHPNLDRAGLRLAVGDYLSADDPHLAHLGAQDDNHQFWTVTGLATDRLGARLHGQTISAHGNTYRVEQTSTGGLQLVPQRDTNLAAQVPQKVLAAHRDEVEKYRTSVHHPTGLIHHYGGQRGNTSVKGPSGNWLVTKESRPDAYGKPVYMVWRSDSTRTASRHGDRSRAIDDAARRAGIDPAKVGLLRETADAASNDSHP